MSDTCRNLLRQYYDQTGHLSKSKLCWHNFKKKHRKKTKEEILNMFSVPSINTFTSTVAYTTFGNCLKAIPVGIPPTKDMETTMNTVDTNTTNARRHISSAICSVSWTVEREALKKFGFVESRTPKTAQELVDWIKADDFILPKIDEDYDEDDYRYEAYKGLTFPPKIKKDRIGFDKYMDEFRKDKYSLELEVQVLEPVDALKNFKKFESKWIH